MDIGKLADELNLHLKSAFQDYMGVYFFGSRKRNDNEKYSDYDMVFVFKTKPDWRKKSRISEMVYLKEVEHDVVIDGKYYSREEIENYQTPFLESVFHEGKFYAV